MGGCCGFGGVLVDFCKDRRLQISREPNTIQQTDLRVEGRLRLVLLPPLARQRVVEMVETVGLGMRLGGFQLLGVGCCLRWGSAGRRHQPPHGRSWPFVLDRWGIVGKNCQRCTLYSERRLFFTKSLNHLPWLVELRAFAAAASSWGWVRQPALVKSW